MSTNVRDFEGEMKMPSGVIKMFNSQRGFGFIVPDGGGKDVFVHIKEAERSGIKELREGDRISYEIATDERSGRPAATNIGLL